MPANSVVTLDAFAEIEDTTGYFEIKDLAQYPKGTMLFASEDVTAAALLTGETGFAVVDVLARQSRDRRHDPGA